MSRARSRSAVEWSVQGAVAWITLNRPRSGNRIDQGAAQALCGAAEAIDLDDRVAVVVVQHMGSAFCLGVEAGGDWERQHDWVAAIGRLRVPVVAAINGPAIAEGCELALACDLRLATARAQFQLPQLERGYLPRHGATQRLPRIVGRMRAADLLLSGRVVRVREAETIGLVTRVVRANGFASIVRKEVAALCEKGAIALRLGKEAVNRALDLPLDHGIRLEQDLYVLLQTTRDRAEGVRAFLEKRHPHFRGR